MQQLSHPHFSSNTLQLPLASCDSDRIAALSILPIFATKHLISVESWLPIYPSNRFSDAAAGTSAASFILISIILNTCLQPHPNDIFTHFSLQVHLPEFLDTYDSHNRPSCIEPILCASRAPQLPPKSRTHLHHLPPLKLVASSEKAMLVCSQFFIFIWEVGSFKP